MWKGTWKCMGVAGLWVFLIVLPHLGPKVIDARFADVMPPLATLADDTGEAAAEKYPKAPEAEPALRPLVAPTIDPRHEVVGSFATIHLENKLGRTLSLVQARVTMDGKELPAVGQLRPDDDRVLFAGLVSPGHHVVDTRLSCRGNRRGVFTYLKDYQWDLRAEEVLTVPQDRAVVFTISAVRNEGVNIPLNKQIGLAVHDEVVPNPFSPPSN
jgi:hypothetical protein